MPQSETIQVEAIDTYINDTLEIDGWNTRNDQKGGTNDNTRDCGSETKHEHAT